MEMFTLYFTYHYGPKALPPRGDLGFGLLVLPAFGAAGRVIGFVRTRVNVKFLLTCFSCLSLSSREYNR